MDKALMTNASLPMQACISTDGCVSFNLGVETGECQLSGARGANLVKNDKYRFYERLDAQDVLVCIVSVCSVFFFLISRHF